MHALLPSSAIQHVDVTFILLFITDVLQCIFKWVSVHKLRKNNHNNKLAVIKLITNTLHANYRKVVHNTD